MFNAFLIDISGTILTVSDRCHHSHVPGWRYDMLHKIDLQCHCFDHMYVMFQVTHDMLYKRRSIMSLLRLYIRFMSQINHDVLSWVQVLLSRARTGK